MNKYNEGPQFKTLYEHTYYAPCDSLGAELMLRCLKGEVPSGFHRETIIDLLTFDDAQGCVCRFVRELTQGSLVVRFIIGSFNKEPKSMPIVVRKTRFPFGCLFSSHTSCIELHPRLGQPGSDADWRRAVLEMYEQILGKR